MDNTEAKNILHELVMCEVALSDIQRHIVNKTLTTDDREAIHAVAHALDWVAKAQAAIANYMLMDAQDVVELTKHKLR